MSAAVAERSTALARGEWDLERLRAANSQLWHELWAARAQIGGDRSTLVAEVIKLRQQNRLLRDELQIAVIEACASYWADGHFDRVHRRYGIEHDDLGQEEAASALHRIQRTGGA